MNNTELITMSSSLLYRARELGADIAGIAHVRDLHESPSHLLAPQLNEEEAVDWPEGGRSVVVVGIAHPKDTPELDWWFGDTPPRGNSQLASVINQLQRWAETYHARVRVHHMPYHAKKGGLFLKDAATQAGLGCVGRNNLFIAPEYGPRVRLRALVINQALLSTGPSAFDPCSSCDAPCLQSCPANAFDDIVHTPGQTGVTRLPARDGSYSRKRCAGQMAADEECAELQETEDGKKVRVIKYCRQCEYECLVGKKEPGGS